MIAKTVGPCNFVHAVANELRGNTENSRFVPKMCRPKETPIFINVTNVFHLIASSGSFVSSLKPG